MRKLIINICASADSFGAFAENCEGIYASGDTIKDVKQDVLDVINIIKEEYPEDKLPFPIKENWAIEWKYDKELGMI